MAGDRRRGRRRRMGEGLARTRVATTRYTALSRACFKGFLAGLTRPRGLSAQLAATGALTCGQTSHRHEWASANRNEVP